MFFVSDNGLSLVCMPSAALQALVPSIDNAMVINHTADGIVNNDTSEINVFNRPSMAFIIEAHNLADLKWAMKQAVRKAACRSYALQVRNLLLLFSYNFVGIISIVLVFNNFLFYFNLSL